MEPLADLLRGAASRASASVVADRRGSFPLAELPTRADALAAHVRATSGRHTPVVAVHLPGSADAVVHLAAAILGGYTVCFLDPGAPGERRDAVGSALVPDVVADTAGVHATGEARVDPVPPGYVAMSSGSTGGGPKGVLTAWDALADFAPAGADALHLDSSSCWAEPTHPGYDLALTNWLLALSAGASLHVSSALVDRLRPLAFTSRVGATHVRLAPRFVDLAAAEAEQGTRAPLRVWASGGDRLTPGHALRALGLGVEAVVNTYGTSETGGFASAAVFTDAEHVTVHHGSVSVGHGVVGARSVEQVRDEPGARADDDACLLAIAAPHLAAGYLFGGGNDPLPRWEPGRVVTGDRGASLDGEWFCLGRGGRTVKRSGLFVSLDDVDAALSEHAGLASFTVAARDGALLTLVEDATADPESLRDQLGVHLAPDLVPDALIPVAGIPRLENGKVDHAAAAQLAEGRAVGV